MGKVIIYLRVSTDEQAESRAGLDAQLDACTRWCKHNEEDLFIVCRDEGISGAADISKRPGLLAAVDHLEDGAVLLVAKRDRLGRDPILVAMIEATAKRKGARIVSAAGEGTDSDNPTDILMRRIVDAFAEYERLIIASRVKAALQAKKARGQRVGYIPYGYRLAEDGVHLEEDEKEQYIRSLVRDMKEQEKLSWRKVAARLNKLEHPNRFGRQWNHVSAWRCFK